MPEEKKESFTFSDKIKASKTAAPKSFANRLSSKIGKDGKPKQTIFERTKRDAPFLIAALVALLLLPFLYKYSGSVSDEPMITPSSEDSVFDPDAERYAFAPDMDPDGQIAQLSGRDSLSLITGFGKDEDVHGDDYDYDYSSRDGFVGTSDASRASAEDTNVDIEENTTNIYKKRAKAATRAAFKRAATKINGLSGASLRPRSGDKLAVGNWGGRMKDAAKRVGTDKPKSSPKPVSLQPLRPAGTPNRSAYGNTAAAMRQAKDALSKADAKQGIMDAMVKPVEPGAFGGMGLSDTAVGGAAGKMDRNFAYSNKEPWWWDLMKTRSQMEWEEEFKRKWDWIKWGDKLAQNILGGLINCLVTGDDGGEVGAFLGSGGGAGSKAPTCCGVKAKDWNAEKYGPFGEESCNKLKKSSNFDSSIKCTKDKWWNPGREGGGERKGIIATRLGCLGLAIGGKYGVGDAVLTEDSAGGECEDLLITEPYKFRVVPQGKAQKWHTYHWIVAHNFVPLEYTQDKANAKGILLCSEGSDHLQMSSHYSSMGATDYLTTDKPTFQAEYAAYEAAKREDDSLTFTSYLAKKYQLDSATANEISAREASVASATTDQQKNKLLQKMCDLAYDYSQKANVHTTEKQRILGEIYPRTDDLCVIYLAQGNQLEYGQFQRNTVEMLKGLIEKSHGMIVPQGETSQQMAEKAFKQLDLAFIEAASMKHKLGYAKWGQSGNKLEEPILYDRFENAYIIHRGVTASATGSRSNVDKRKYRLEDEEYVRSKKCNFDADVHLECTDNSLPPFATVKKGNLARHPVGDIQVTAHFTPVQGSEQITVADFSATITAAQPANVYPFVYQTLKDAIPQGKNADGTVAWKVSYSRNGVPFTQTRTCIFGAGGEPAPQVPHPECTEGQIQPLDQVDQDGCKLQQRCVSAHWVKEKVDPNCPSTPPVVGAKVRFYPTISKMPKGVLIDGKPTDRPALDNNNLEKQWPQCKVDEVSPMQLEYYDRETHDYMKGVIADYTAANGTRTSKPMEDYVTQTGETPTIAQVVDAMRIASALGKTTVPKNTVCAVARTIGHYSRDPHTKGLNTNDNPLKYSNTFGAFAAYTGYDSSFFPTMRLTDTNSGNNRSIDYRYHGCWDQLRTNVHMDQQIGAAMNGDNVNLGGALGTCGGTRNSYSGADKECSGFHYGHYNWNHYVQHDLQKGATCAGDRTGKACLQDDRDPYEKVLDASIWGANGARFPLQALSQKKGSSIFSRNWGRQFQRQYRNGTIDSYNRTKYHDAYKAIFHLNDVSCGYDADDTMNVNDALRYVDSLCANGMERKPSNGGEIPCAHYYLADHEGR